MEECVILPRIYGISFVSDEISVNVTYDRCALAGRFSPFSFA